MMFYGIPPHMRDAFNWGGRKRTGSMGTNTTSDRFDDPYFDDVNVFPRFGSSRRPTSSRHHDGFFSNLPPEFQQYIPDEFGFPSRRQQQQQSHPIRQQYTPQQSVPVQTGPIYCDAAMQTDDPSTPATDTVDYAMATNQSPLQQHNLRNTVDLGQKSQQEQIPSERAQSDPPRNKQFSGNGASASASSHGDNTFVVANTQANSPHQDIPNKYKSYYYPHDQMSPDAAHARRSQGKSPPPHQSNQDTAGGFVRTVPIFVEGSNVPVTPTGINRNQQPPFAQSPPQAPQRKQPKPEPFIPKTDEHMAQQSTGVPPQTPYTSDCIGKIQDIQRDVLDLMGKVESFNGIRGDKDYLYLDEMLTRNLLKLDTIDTNGKDSIRLARKEAIKCIQASIHVLEAKAETNAKKANTQTADNLESPANENEVVTVEDVPKQIDPNVAIPLKNAMEIDEDSNQPSTQMKSENEQENPTVNPSVAQEVIATEGTSQDLQGQVDGAGEIEDLGETKPKKKSAKKLIQKFEDKAKNPNSTALDNDSGSEQMDTIEDVKNNEKLND